MKEATKILKNFFIPSSERRLERRIPTLLRKNLSPEEVFEKIKNHSEVNQVSCFLYNAGMDKTLLNFSINRLQRKKSVAWPYILKIFIKYKIIPKADLGKMIFSQWLTKKENHSDSLFACEEWASAFPEFQQLRSVYLQELEESNVSEENELLEQLAFVQAQNLIKEEEEIITKLLFINPENSQYKKARQELEEKKALQTIQEQKKWISKPDRLETYAPSPEKPKLKEDWMKAISQTAKENPERTKNLSLFLYFCNAPDKALDMLSTHIGHISDYWFYLDWALETKQYTKGLELINHLFIEVKEGGMFFLPLIYIKSQMLYALGKKREALEYLTAISQVQPDYKSVQYLLEKWSQEA